MQCHFCGRAMRFHHFKTSVLEENNQIMVKTQGQCPECNIVYEAIVVVDDKLKPIKYSVKFS